MLPTVLLFSVTVNCVVSDSLQILKTMRPKPQQEDLELLLTQMILRILDDVNCIALFSDDEYQSVFGPGFYSSIRDVPSFFVQVNNDEDLLAPNYQSLKLIRAVRRSGCRVNILLFGSPEQVTRFLKFGDRHRELDTRANFILLHDRYLQQPDFHYLWKKIVNVVFVRKFASRPGIPPWYEIFTVPYPNPILEVLRLRRLDLWRSGTFKQNALLFRDKTDDLRGQILRVVTFQHMPASFKVPAPSVKPDVTVEGVDAVGYTGVEIEAVTTLSRIMNFNADVYEPLSGTHINTNTSLNDLIAEVTTGRADIVLGDLHHTPHNLKFMDLTIPYTTQCLTFLTPEALTDNSWQTLILPFKGFMWTGVLISLIAGSIIFFILAKFHETMENDSSQLVSKNVVRNNLNPTPKVRLEGLYQFSHADNSLLYTYSMLLLVSLPKLPAGWSLRVLTGCWWLYSILVVVAYRASMTAILANPAPRVTIDNLDQLADTKIAAGGWDEQTKKFFQTSIDSAGKKVGSRFEIVRDIDAAVARVANGEFAFYENIYFLQYASVRRQILSLKADHKKETQSMPSNRNLHIMANCVINMPISIGLQKNSPLKPRIDRYLRLITQGGLAQKWLRDAMAQVLSADRSNAGQSQKALMDLKKFLGALVALGVGYLISTLFFAIEVIYWKFTVARNPNYDRYANAIILIKKVNNEEASEKNNSEKNL